MIIRFLFLPSLAKRITAAAVGGLVAAILVLEWNPPSISAAQTPVPVAWPADSLEEPFQDYSTFYTLPVHYKK